MFAALANKVLVGLYFTYEYPSAYSLAYDFIKYGIKDQKYIFVEIIHDL